MNTTPKYIWILTTLVVVTLLLAQSGCSGVISTGEDTSYLTPIPEGTLWAYEYGELIDSKMEAVIVAQRELYTTRLHFAEPPQAIYVEKISYGEAMKLLGKNAEQNLGEEQVWLVVFKGEYQIVPPGENPTPGAEGTGCAYAILSVADEPTSGLGQMGTTGCENFQPE